MDRLVASITQTVSTAMAPSRRLPRLLYAVLCTMALSTDTLADAARIFILHSYSQEYPWTQRQHEGFVDALEAAGTHEWVIETEYLDTKRRQYTDDYTAGFADYLRFKYTDFKPNAIYVSDDNALDFALNHLDQIFPDVAVVFSGVNDLDALRPIDKRRVTGVFEKKDIATNLALLESMGEVPNDIIVVGDGSNTHQAIEREIRAALRERPHIRAGFVVANRLRAILKGIAEQKGQVLFFTSLGGVKDRDGQIIPLQQMIRRIVANRQHIAISMEDVYLTDGVLGGYVTSGLRQGDTAAQLLITYLQKGVLPPPVTRSPNEYLLDARELARHGLTLPPAIADKARLLNRPLSFYQRHRIGILYALGGVSVLFVASLLIFLWLLARKNQQIRTRSIVAEEQAAIAMRAEDSLNEAQQLARQGSWDWQRDAGVFTWSDGLKHLCGYPAQSAVDGYEAFLQHLPDSDRAGFVQAVKDVCDLGTRYDLTHQLICVDARIRVVRHTIKPLHSSHSGPKQIIGTVQDITERQAAAQQLRESEEKYRLLFELSDDPMWLIQDNNFIMANDAAARTLGYTSSDELLNIHPCELSPTAQSDGRLSRDKAEEMMANALDSGYHSFEWIHRHKDGSPFAVEVSLTKIPYHGKAALFCIWHDISEIKKVQKSLEEKTAFLNSILSSSEKIAIIATDADGRVQYYNAQSERLFGMPAAQAIGTNLLGIQHFQGISDERANAALRCAREKGEYRFTMDSQHADGPRHVDARISPIVKSDQRFAGYMLMCEDVTDQRRASELIKYQASYDALTDLPNRRLFLDQLQQALARSKRHEHQSAVLFLDLDNFKTINDSLGHPVGDHMLHEVAARIRHGLREEDTVARLGGDEFVVLFCDLAPTRGEAVQLAQHLAEKIRQKLAEPYLIENHDLQITTSIGIAIFPSGNETTDDIVRQADTAMYKAKEAGRNAIRFFLPSMQTAVEQRLKLINQLRQALLNHEFQLHYQPQFDTSRNLSGVEALLRWSHPERGMVMPGEFIHLAEEAGLVLPIGDWVLRTALAQISTWHHGGMVSDTCRVAVNVSALQFHQPDFVDSVEQALSDTGASPKWLTLEMTESILLQDVDETVERMRTLKRLGVRFSIDDFGTGYSSLAYLKRLPVDEIKIDRSFVRDIMVDANDAALVDTILTLASHIQLEVVAEGVESAQIFEFLRQRGCPFFQGYHFGRPVSAEDFAIGRPAHAPHRVAGKVS